MRFYTKELWSGIQSPDASVRETAEKAWRENGRAYAQCFEQIKPRFSKQFLKDYTNRSGLHDDRITDISLKKEKRGYSCVFTLEDGDEVLELCLKKVGAVRIDVPTFTNCIQGALRWGYAEFAPVDEKTMNLSVLCDLTNELSLDFQTISLKTVKLQER